MMLTAFVILMNGHASAATDKKPTITIKSKPSDIGERIVCIDGEVQYGYWDENEGREVEPGSIVEFETTPTDYHELEFQYWLTSYGEEIHSTYVKYEMQDHDVVFTAVYGYNPETPLNPSGNSFNENTGEAIVSNFVPGSLKHALGSLVYWKEEYLKILRVYGEVSEDDLDIDNIVTTASVGHLDNLEIADYSHANGAKKLIGGAFYGVQSLKELILPESIDQFAERVFVNAPSCLKSITLLSPEPPSVYLGDSDYYDSFNGLAEDAVFYVPVWALGQYKSAKRWKDLNVQPIPDNTSTLVVRLPDDAGEGRYDQMVLILMNGKSGQVSRQTVNRNTEYTFYGLNPSAEYSATLETPAGVMAGGVDGIKLKGGETLYLTLTDLASLSNVTIRVLDPNDGKDVTSGMRFNWRHDGRSISASSTVTHQVEGTELTCSILPGESLAALYCIPEDVRHRVAALPEDTVTVRLVPIEKALLAGTVTDAKSHAPIGTATVTATAKFGDVASSSQTVSSSADGSFNIEAPSTSGVLHVSAPGYLSRQYDMPFDGPLSVELSKLSGTKIMMNVDYVPVDEDEVMTLPKVAYSSATDLDFKVEQNNILFTDTLSQGTVIPFVASSPAGKFSDISFDVTVGSDRVMEYDLSLVEKGSLNVSLSSDTDDPRCVYLYGSDGNLLRSGEYVDGKTVFTSVDAGHYYVVTMGYNPRFKAYSSLDALKNSFLAEGDDYSVVEAEVSDGVNTAVMAPNTGSLNIENKILDDQNYVICAANDYRIGDYVLVKAKYTLKSQYEPSMSDFRLMMEIPEGCELVENSVTVDSKPVPYYMEGRTLVAGVSSRCKVSLCLRALKAGVYQPSVLVKGLLDESELQASLGTVYIRIKDYSLICPGTVYGNPFMVSGLAPVNSEIYIYDEDVLIGMANTDLSGHWNTEVSLINCIAGMIHKIHGNIMLSDGTNVRTEIKYVEVANPKDPKLLSTSLTYYGDKVVFNMDGKDPHPMFYTYKGQLGKYDYTFMADLSVSNPELIKNPLFVVTGHDNSKTLISASWDAELRKFIGKGSFPYGYDESFSVPVLVEFDYDYEDVLPADYVTEIYDYEDSRIDELCDVAVSEINVGGIETEGNLDSAIVQFDILQTSCDISSKARIIQIRTDELEKEYPQVSENPSTGKKIHFGFFNNGTEFRIFEWNSADSYGVCMIVDIASGTPSVENKRPYRVVAPVIIGIPLLIDLYGTLEDAFEENAYWTNLVNKDKKDNERRYETDLAYIYAKNKDGSYVIEDYDVRDRLWGTAAMLKGEMNLLLQSADEYRQSQLKLVALTSALKVCGNVIGKVMSAAHILPSWAEKIIELGETLNDVKDIVKNGMEMMGVDPSWINLLMGVDMKKQYDLEKLEIYRKMTDLRAEIIYAYPNKNDWDVMIDIQSFNIPDKRNQPTKKVEVIIDPSGFVYEGDVDHRLENVRATVYYKDEAGNDALWDAYRYGQENPLYTDKDGCYEWNVPAGLWQVRFEKDGYLSTQSEWLPVPPPQVDVNVPMQSLRVPAVEEVHAYRDNVCLKFDKLMDAVSFVDDKVARVLDDGRMVSGEWCPVGGKDIDETFMFIPVEPFKSGTLSLTVSGKAKCYAGVEMGSDYTKELDIEKEIMIEVPSHIEVGYGEAAHIRLAIEPADAAEGLVVKASLPSGDIAALVGNDIVVHDGEATVSVIGRLPGAIEMSMEIPGTFAKAETILDVVYTSEALPAPTASIPTGSTLESGSRLMLYCGNKAALIRYTVDGSDPRSSSNAIDYSKEEGISLTKDVTVKAVAFIEGDGYSDVSEFSYFIDRSDVRIDSEERHEIEYSGGFVRCKGSDSISVFDLSGRRVRETRGGLMDTTGLKTGVYIAIVRCHGKTMTRKILKK